MKSLLKFLSPFAPDQSGAVSVLFDFGGMIVVCDAGGCTGNICGFDEPRWFTRKSALFSAGLRDMDAILGRDDKLVSKLQKALSGTDLSFAALIGTPVPAVIATDFKALKRMAEKRTGLPIISLEATGTRYYDKGAEEAYLQLFQNFALEELPKKIGTLGVLGATPLDFSCVEAGVLHSELLRQEGVNQVFCYGMGAGMKELRRASSVEKNLVVSPSGLKAAEYLRKTFGIPYSVGCPWIPKHVEDKLQIVDGKRVLIVHQQFSANALGERIQKKFHADVRVASWFMMFDEWKQPDDFFIESEETFSEKAGQGAFDVIIADSKLKRVLRDFKGVWIDYPHFAISGRLEQGD